jgi:hypothetical protein
MKSSDSLSKVLQIWRVSPPPDPDFRAAVWQRVEETRRAPTWPVFVRTRATALTAAAIVTVAVSGWAGHSVARNHVQADRNTLAANYLASLDARVKAGLQE